MWNGRGLVEVARSDSTAGNRWTSPNRHSAGAISLDSVMTGSSSGAQNGVVMYGRPGHYRSNSRGPATQRPDAGRNHAKRAAQFLGSSAPNLTLLLAYAPQQSLSQPPRGIGERRKPRANRRNFGRDLSLRGRMGCGDPAKGPVPRAFRAITGYANRYPFRGQVAGGACSLERTALRRNSLLTGKIQGIFSFLAKIDDIRPI